MTSAALGDLWHDGVGRAMHLSGDLHMSTCLFTGLLGISLRGSYGDSGRGMDVGLCMHFEEPADRRATYVHTLDLYLL